MNVFRRSNARCAAIKSIGWLTFTIAIVVGCATGGQSAFTDTKKLNKEYVPTFKLPPCQLVIVEDYEKTSDASDNTPPRVIREIRDEAAINKIRLLAGALPDEGQIMKKIANPPLLRTTLMYAEDTLFFDYYGTSVKTPATSFYAKPPREEFELYEFLRSVVK